MYPGTNGILKSSLSFLKNIKLGAILDGTSKTLGVINQAIPVYYQVKPIVSNIGTLFKISNSIKEENPEEEKKTSNIFFV